MIILDFHFFKLGFRGFYYLEKIVTDGYFFACLRNTFVIMYDISRQSLVVVRFRKIVFVGFVEIVYFESRRENPVVLVDGLLDVVLLVVLVLNLAENLLNEVLGGDNACCAAELIDDDRDALAFLRQSLQ